MILITGRAAGTELTGSIYEPGEDPPAFRGAPDEDAAYVWICDAFYETESGGSTLEIDDRELTVAFERPMPQGFDTRDRAIAAATDHVRTQFARIGVDSGSVSVIVETVDAADPEFG